MSYNICALSGKLTSHPVICRKNGLIFDKEIIMSCIDSTGICPITSIPLTKEDILDIDSNSISNPRSTDEASIEGLLNKGKNDINELIKEIGELKFKISESKKQLSTECYKYEAAINVIHKLIQEKEIAKSQIEQYQNMISNK